MLLIRAKQDFDAMAKSNSDSGNPLIKLDDQSKANDQLRKEHHQAIMAVIELKEEFSSKLLILNDKHESSRAKLLKENSGLSRRIESLQTQIGYMEKKEIKLFG